MSGVPSGGDRFAEIETWVYNGNYASGDDVLALVEIAKAAEDWLENDHLPGGGRMRRKERLRAALARLDSGAAE